MNENNTYNPQNEGTGYTPPKVGEENINPKTTPETNTGEAVPAGKLPDEKTPGMQPAPQQSQGVPPPPKPEDEVGIRTMNDDVSSVESSGGSVGEPKTFRPKDLLKNDTGGQQSQQTSGIPSPDGQAQPQPQPKKNHAKLIILSVLGFLLLAGIAVAGFIYVPKFLGGSDTEPTPTTPPVSTIEPSVEFFTQPSSIQRGESAVLVWDTTDATSVSIDEMGEVGLSGSIDITPTEATSYRIVASNSEGVEVEETITIEVVQPSDTFEHTSLFPESSNVSQVSLSMSSVSVESYNSSINESMNADANIEFAETLPLLEGNAINSYNLLSVFISTLSEDYLRNTMAEDYTAFAYKDSNGVWPGFMVEINKDVDGSPVDFSDLSNTIKQTSETFYASSPGSPQANEFQEGASLSDNMTSIEFLAYSAAGASFNIATLEVENKTYLLWSTSFDGIKEAVSALGF